MRYSFTIRVSGLSTDADHYENALYEAGCDDALIAVIDDTIFVDFDREATSFEEAVRSATLNIEKAGGKVIEVKRIIEWELLNELWWVSASLPIAAEIDARLVPHRQRYNAIDLDAVRVFPMILSPRSLLRETDEIRTREVMMVPDLGAAHAAKKRFGIVAVDAVAETVSLLVIDPVQREPSMKLVPCARFRFSTRFAGLT
jgi:hypothetical protein